MAADGTYIKPGFFTARVFNPVVKLLVARLGLEMKGARVLSVRGRTTGVWHSTPVNLLDVDGQRYLVSARGETQWVRNIRVSRAARITRGRETETVHVEEIADAAKAPILRAYLRAWEWEVGRFFDGVGASAPEADLARIAPKHPVFRVVS
jgi:deazaflavin-dependent oxidoreductase (nitroreductase family)